MARYICSYLVPASVEDVESILTQLLENCDFEMTYSTSDYIMAREKPGKVTFGKLVTVEILVDSTTATKEQVQINLVVKNDQLPLQTNNHCNQLFKKVQEVIAKEYQWQLVESVPT